jgi:O-antigen/teichoic acid export membrane protein
MTLTLRQRMISGLIWSAVERFGYLGAQFIITIIIARLLKPADYGLIAMLSIFIAVANSFMDSGFSSALIQRKNANQTDFSTIFYFNILLAFIFFLILFFSAPLIASFYSQPLIIPLTRLMGINLIINSFGLVQNTILIKQINFESLTKVSLFSTFLSGILGVLLAARGFGVWSLVVQAVVGRLLNTALLWTVSGWRPTREFSLLSLRSLFSFGSKLLAAGLLNQVFENIYKLIIGKFYSVIELGYYYQANRIQEIPVQTSLSILQRVTYPAYSTIQDDIGRLKRAYKKTIKASILINFPIMVMLIVTAPNLISLLLTEKWLSAAKFLQLLCLSGLIYPLSAVNLNILKVRGRSDIFFYLEVVKKVIIVLAIVITIKMGVLLMVIGQVIAHYLCFILNIYYSGRMISYSIREQISDIFPYFAAALSAGVCMNIPLLFFRDKNILLLFIQLLFGGITYAVLIKGLKLEAFSDITATFSERFGRIKREIYKVK